MDKKVQVIFLQFYEFTLKMDFHIPFYTHNELKNFNSEY